MKLFSKYKKYTTKKKKTIFELKYFPAALSLRRVEWLPLQWTKWLPLDGLID